MRLSEVGIERIHTWVFYLLGGFALFSNVSIAVGNIFLGTLTALVLFRLWRRHDDWQDALPDGRVGMALLILMGVLVLCSLFSNDVSYSLRVFGDYYGYRMIAFYAVLLMIREKRQLARIGICVAASFVVNGLAIIAQGIVYGNMRADGFSFSMTSGGFLSMLLPALAVLLMSGRLDARYRIPAAATLLVGCAALLFNGTRGAWVAVPIDVLVCAALLVRDKKRLLAGMLAAVVVFGTVFALSPALSSRFASIGDTKMQSNSERFLLWTSAAHMFTDHPVLGIGYAGFEAAYHEQYILPEAKERELGHAHSNVMQMLGECGAVGLAALLFWWGACLSYGIRAWRTAQHIAGLLLPAVLLGLILQGLTEYNMGNSSVMKLHWLLMGLCLQWLRLDLDGRRIR